MNDLDALMSATLRRAVLLGEIVRLREMVRQFGEQAYLLAEIEKLQREISAADAVILAGEQ